MPLSPKVDQMMQMPGADQEQQIFEQSFSEMAQSLLMNKLPEVAADVATFKIVDSDIDTGSAVGAFIVQRPNTALYIPVVLVENQLKPLEVMYSQSHDVFLPLSPEWLSELERGALEPLGEATKTPESLYTDVDIRNLIVPPTTGRYSFASVYAPEIEKADKWVADKAGEVGKTVKKTVKNLKLPEALRKATNDIKKKFASVLENDRDLLKVAVAIYGSKELLSALQETAEKTAAEVQKSSTEEFAIATKKTPAQEVKSLFGPAAPEAMKGIATKGYAAKDTRRGLNRPVDEEGSVKLQQVGGRGAFKLFKKDGSSVDAYVMPAADHAFKYDKHTGANKVHKDHRLEHWVLTADGKFYSCGSCLYGEPLQAGEITGSVAAALKGESKPKAGRGIFVRNNAGHVEFTEPFEIESSISGSDGVKRFKAKQHFSSLVIVMDDKVPGGKIQRPKDSGLLVMPTNFKWVPVSDLDEHELPWDPPFIKDPSQLTSAAMRQLKAAGGTSVSVKKAGADDYLIGGTNFTGTRVETVVKLAQDYRISCSDAEQVIGLADERGTARVVMASVAALTKLAEGDSKDKKKDSGSKPAKPPTRKTTVEEPVDGGAGGPPQGDPTAGDPGMDPGAEGGADMAGADPGADAGMDPAAAAAAAAPPSPTDQAVAELQEEVTRAHEEQMKLLQHKIDALQMVAQRTQEIVQGVPKEQSTAIQQAVSTAASGQPQAGGVAPAGEPGAPADPAAAGMDPNAPIDPSMMQEAAGLADPSMFDAAAIGSLAEHGSMKDLVGTYMPTLEKSVDHIGRILLTLWMKGADLRGQMGEQNYSNLEDKLRNLFRGLGDVVLRLNRDSLILAEHESPEGHEAAGL